MTQAFYTGLSGLKSQQQAIDVVADNLSNVSTVGFRGYTAEFSNMFEEMINTDAQASSVDSSVGIGTKLNTVTMNESMGVFRLSDRSTDLAILGDGWFGIQGESEPFYTRDGSFTFDANRDLVTHDGYYVLGTMGTNIDEEILTEKLYTIPLSDVATQEKLRFPANLTIPAEPTTIAKFYGNLKLDKGQEQVTISARVINSEGIRNNLRLEFEKVDPQVLPGSQWSVVATTESRDDNTVYSTESGVVSFDYSGALISSTLSTIDNQGVTVSMDLGNGYDGITATNASFSSSSSSNGVEKGDLLGYDINKDAEVIATFSNGLQSTVGTIAVYHFANDRGLDRSSGARFSKSGNSGEAIFFKDKNGQNIIGTEITNLKLEGSNVRMDVGLTEIIVMQRAYDANSKSITTADQMLQKALDMDA